MNIHEGQSLVVYVVDYFITNLGLLYFIIILFCFASLLAQAKGGTPFAVIKRNIAAHWTNLQVVVHHLISAHNTAGQSIGLCTGQTMLSF